MRFIRRALLEHRRLPRLVRIFRTCQAVGIAFLVSSMFAVLILRPSTAVMNVWLVIITIPLLVSVFGVGLLTWRNYQHAAEIWAENVRGRGLDSAGLGWLMDAGTARAMEVTPCGQPADRARCGHEKPCLGAERPVAFCAVGLRTAGPLREDALCQP